MNEYGKYQIITQMLDRTKWNGNWMFSPYNDYHTFDEALRGLDRMRFMYGHSARYELLIMEGLTHELTPFGVRDWNDE